MSRKSPSKSQLQSDYMQHHITKIDPVQVSAQFQNSLMDASRVLQHIQFKPLFQSLIRILLNRAEIQSPNTQAIFLHTIKVCIQKYGSNLQLDVKTLLLQVLCDLNSSMLDSILIKLQKCKHLVIHSPYQYLLSKIFLLEEKYYIIIDDEETACKKLKKCLQLNEDHMVQYFQASQQIRKEIVDLHIITCYEYYRLKKSSKLHLALQYLSKAFNAAKKHYGIDNKITLSLQNMHLQQQNMFNNLDKISIKSQALTQIVKHQNKKNYMTYGYYSWQQQKIIAQLIKTKGNNHEVISQTTYEIKLDINKIKQIKNSDWLSIVNGHVIINEDELLKHLGVQPPNSFKSKQMTTRVEVKNISRQEIIKKDFQSSDDEDEDDTFFQKDLFKFMKPKRSHSTKQKQSHQN